MGVDRVSESEHGRMWEIDHIRQLPGRTPRGVLPSERCGEGDGANMSASQDLSILILLLVLAVWPCTAPAVKIEIENFDNGLMKANLTGIDQIEGRVYTLDPDAGEITFGDGLSGTRPPSGRSGIIGAYRFGDGSIFKEFDLVAAHFPLPIATVELRDPQSADTKINIVLAGISALQFELTTEYMTVVAADVVPVPLPATAWLFGSGLLGLLGIARRKAA